MDWMTTTKTLTGQLSINERTIEGKVNSCWMRKGGVSVESLRGESRRGGLPALKELECYRSAVLGAVEGALTNS